MNRLHVDVIGWLMHMCTHSCQERKKRSKVETQEYTKFAGSMCLGIFWPLELFRSNHKGEPHADDVKKYTWNGKTIFGVILADDGKVLPVLTAGEPGCIRLTQESGLQASHTVEVENEA